MKKLFQKAVTLALVLGISSSVISQGIKQLEGAWRGEFTIRDTIKVPFNFEIRKDGMVRLLNASEKFDAGKLEIRNDSIFVPLDQFDNIIAFKKAGNGKLTGTLRKQDNSETFARVNVEKGKTHRFDKNLPPAARNFSGKYAVHFKASSGWEEDAIGIFNQKGNRLEATFLKPSGDTRYLEGVVTGNSFYLSNFIGSTPGYYRGTISETDQLSAVQIGTKTNQEISGRLDPNAELHDAYRFARANDSEFNFSLPDADGNIISLNNEKYRDKPVIVSITGTWCPNCIDEAQYLSPWYKENKARGIEIVLVHFERQADTAFAARMMRRFRLRFDITYDQVIGGTPSKENVLKALPGLSEFSFYPTTIFVDRQRRVTRIHSGFSGPATGKYYEDFKKEFNDEIDKMLGDRK